MIAPDTNVLARALVNDPKSPKQSAAARARLAREPELFIPAVVQAELVWVMETAFELTKPEVLAVLEHLHDNAAYQLENEVAFVGALSLFRTGPANFSDYLILVAARTEETPLLTFDKKLARAAGAQLLAA